MSDKLTTYPRKPRYRLRDGTLKEPGTRSVMLFTGFVCVCCILALTGLVTVHSRATDTNAQDDQSGLFDEGALVIYTCSSCGNTSEFPADLTADDITGFRCDGCNESGTYSATKEDS